MSLRTWWRDLWTPVVTGPEIEAHSGGSLALVTLPDAIGTGTPVSVASLFGLPQNSRAWVVVFREITGGPNAVRIGGSDVSATNGVPLTAGESFILPPVGDSSYNLSQIYVYCPAVDTLSIGILV